MTSDLPAPEPPAEQVALRATVEALLRDYEGASCSHHDRFWESRDGRQAVHGWGTTIVPRTGGGPIEIWFDGLDLDVTIDQVRGRWLRGRTSWHEWRDLSDLPEVLADVTRVLRDLLDADR